MQMVHCIRSELIGRRTALVNQISGLLSERGIVINQGIRQLRSHLPLILEDAENNLFVLSREMFAKQYEKLKALDLEIKEQDQCIGQLCNANKLSQRLLHILAQPEQSF